MVAIHVKSRKYQKKETLRSTTSPKCQMYCQVISPFLIFAVFNV